MINLHIICIVMCIISFFKTVLPPLLDNWTIEEIKNEKKFTYRPIRLWGFIGFTLTVFIMYKRCVYYYLFTFT
ncbi:MFS transporter [Abyssisolibacter fermentans]|uniref:MFS transporter n=1 Tax=Abyssisolibacter fermentans TaxID=1766203 RepID=UPI003B82FA5D